MNLAAVVREGLMLAALVLAPVVAAAAAASVGVGWLAGRFGLRDPSVVMIGRAIAVVLALIVAGEWMSERLVTSSRALWSRLGEVE